MMPTDFIGRYCWAASAIGGAWRWQSAAERETAVETLSFCYVANARRRSEMSDYDQQALEVMMELGNLIAGTLTKAASRRIVRKINNATKQMAAERNNDLPF